MLYYKQKQTSWKSATCWQDYALNWTIFSSLYSNAVPDDETSHNITEEIAAELTEDDYTAKQISSSDDSSITASSVAWKSGSFYRQNLEDQRRQNKQQYTLIKKRQKILSDKTKHALEKLEGQKDAALKSKDNDLYDQLILKERKIRKYHREHKEELYR